MANTLLALTTKQLIKKALVKPVFIQTALASDGGSYVQNLIGKREVVGFGFNGEPTYVDRVDFPLPAIRWKEPTADILVFKLPLNYKVRFS